ncbi:hypothetical protein OKW11_004198 [Pseudomonas baetica]|nr:hypothetical protein [Pseudomonas baetica]
MDYFIIVVMTVAGLYFHWWLYVRIKRWMDRDLARTSRKKPSCSNGWRVLRHRRSSVETCRSGWRPLRQVIPVGRLLRVPDVQESSRRPAGGN